jgi:hypothetical protein
MTTEHPNPNWPGSTYNGFAGPAVGAEAPPASPTPRRRVSQPWMLGGIAAAVAAGVALGFVAQPKPVSAAKAEAAATPLPVELVDAAPTPTAPPTARLDVRPAVDAAPPVVAAPQPLPPPPSIEPAPRERSPLLPEELELSRPADAPDDPGIYEEVEEPAWPS